MSPPFRLPVPYVLTHRVIDGDLDDYRHVNNAVYLQWLDRIAWAHSAALGVPLARCLAERRGMAVRHTRVDYLDAARLDDILMIATWIVASDGRLRCTRRFEILRIPAHERLLEAEIDFFSLNLDTGKPIRFPPHFSQCYAPLPEVLEAYAELADSSSLGRWRR